MFFAGASLLYRQVYCAAAIVSYALRRFCDTIDLLVLKRNHYNKETKMRKSRTTLIENKLGSAQVPKFGRLLIKIDSSASIP